MKGPEFIYKGDKETQPETHEQFLRKSIKNLEEALDALSKEARTSEPEDETKKKAAQRIERVLGEYRHALEAHLQLRATGANSQNKETPPSFE